MENLSVANRLLRLLALSVSVALPALQGAVLYAAAPPTQAVTHPDGSLVGGSSRVAPGFVPNRGQMTSAVRYSARLSGYTALFTDRGAVFAFSRHALKLQFIGASGPQGIDARDQLSARMNYLVGSDRSRWQIGLPTYGAIVYREIWRGVDLAFRDVSDEIKYEMTVSPGARVDAIRLEYQGARRLSINAAGDLVIDTPEGVLVDHRPRSHQVIDGKEVAVETRFVVDASKHRYGFRVGAYDRTRPLVIDPGLVYAAYIGGSGDDHPRAVAADASGNIYVAGQTTSLDFPDELDWVAALEAEGLVVLGVSDRFGDSGLFVTKLSEDGLVWTTFLGLGEARGLLVNEWGGLIVSGVAYPGTSLPATASFGPSSDVNRAFVAGLSPRYPGSDGGNANTYWVDGVGLDFSVMVGGTQSSEAHAMAVDSNGIVYVVGRTESADFPTSAGAFQSEFQGPSDAFAFAWNGTELIYSTFLGGSGDDLARGVAVDGDRNAYVAGITRSVDFPVTPGGWDLTAGGGSDGFVTRLNASGSALVYSTYLGGAADDDIGGVALDTAGNAFVSGTTSSADFPTTAAAFQSAMSAAPDGVITALDSTGGALKYSTFIGGSNADTLSSVALNQFDDVYVFGTSRSADFPTTGTAVSRTLAGGVNDDAIVVRFDSSGRLRYATYLGGDGNESAGGLAVDVRGDVYVVGQVEANASFPPLPAGHASTGVNGYLAKLIPRTSLSFNQPAAASSAAGAASSAANAVDGDLTTEWLSESSDPQWIAVDLGSSMAIERVWWKWGSVYATDSEVQVSVNGVDWTIAGVLSGAVASRGDLTFAPILARYVRILGLRRSNTAQGYSLVEMDVFAPLESAPVAAPNTAPTVSVISPSDGSTFTLTPYAINITFAADAGDVDGAVERVEFWVDGIMNGFKTEAPYSGLWSVWAPGTYVLTARAFDYGGAGTVSAPVTVTVLPGLPNASPFVTITSPSNGATFVAPATIAVTADAADSDDGVVKVEFWVNGTLHLGTDITAPYTASWNTSLAGQYRLTAIAFDSVQGALSQSVTVTVKPPNAPSTVSITSPPNGTTIIAPSTISVAADASDSDGIAHVDFFTNGSLIGIDSTAPYAIAWNVSAIGSYTLTAQAVDSTGAVTTSAPVTIAVQPNKPPTVNITSPAGGTVFAGVPVLFTIAADALDSDGIVARVEFFVDGSLIGTDSTAPYSVGCSLDKNGTYSLTARAVDNLGAVATSTPVSVRVSNGHRR